MTYPNFLKNFRNFEARKNENIARPEFLGARLGHPSTRAKNLRALYKILGALYKFLAAPKKF